MPTHFAFSNTPPSSHPTPKLHLTNGTLPPYISANHPPTQKPPFRQVHDSPFVATTTLLLPDDLYASLIFSPKFPPALLRPRHAKLHLSLLDILSEPVLTHIQTPGTHLLLLSEGTPGVDDMYSLRDGVLRLDLGRERYERVGLQGRAVAGGGRKHVKERYVVEADLRGLGMRAGKKGFERWRWAAREILTERRTWLGLVGMGGEEGEGVLEGLGAEWREGEGEGRVERDVRVPVGLLTGKRSLGNLEVDEEDVWGLVEWADLVALGSPRVKDSDRVDEFVSRYELPEKESSDTVVGKVRILRWTGLLSSQWVLSLLMELVRASRVQKTRGPHWMALSVAGHQLEAVGNLDGYTIFLQPDESLVDTSPEQKDNQGKERDTAMGGTTNGQEKPETERDGGAMEIDSSATTKERTGFQRFVSMQLVDSMAVARLATGLQPI
ncbi:uncharacterized protein HMPREF1541_09222 [Cyphellophora europaea CBS 101466]|uniref:Uncharacterized protein n=1 Tax=Cyphellophora europaea (strain CBS 101466) TaxID=1220924 RepID=W2S9K9_CYPE1|nr:uncharacterized protein HMPREF1541_09222 [Cyphellophora europaea CBS 101466]ETN45391.1 hypothetical protein HMPREF1541_09222 [Cyphellophora europaea CBS 101466]